MILANKVTLKDIGRQAGVTAATVSYVLSSNKNVSIKKETQRKVLKIAKELGYSQNYLARSFSMNKSSTVGLLISKNLNFYAPVVSGVEESLALHHYMLYLLDVERDKEIEHSINLYRQRRIDGLLIFGPMSTAHIELLFQEQVPFVDLSWHFEDSRITTVSGNDIRCGELAGRHLLSLGHRRFAFLTGTGDWNISSKKRFEGFSKVLKAAGIDHTEDMIIQCGWRPEQSYESTKQMLSRGNVATAMFCYSDSVAYGALRALAEAGVKVPQQISVIGVDDLPFSEYTYPPLTTVKWPGREIGQMGAETLLEMIDSKDVPFTPRQLLLNPELKARQSTGVYEG
jgi:DNA-binding LacI/PurR family transcriptional regulator